MKELSLNKDILKIRNDVEIIKDAGNWLMVNPVVKTWVKIPKTVGELLSNPENKVLENIISEHHNPQEVFDFVSEMMQLGFIEPLHRGYERIYFCVTERCNLKCTTCYRDLSQELDITTQEMKDLMYKIALLKPKELVITGGEPTLREDLCEILDFAKEASNKIVLLTNATFITEQLAEYLARENIKVQISLDSLNEIKNDSIRGQGSFVRAKSGIDLLLSKGVKNIEITMTLFDYIGANMYEVKKYWEEKRIAFHSSLFMNMHPTMCKLGTRDCGQLTNMFLNYIETKANKDLVDTKMKLCDLIELIPGEGCMAGEKILSISQKGKVYPCHLLMYDELGVDINDIISGKKDRLHIPNVKTINECSSCNVRHFCRGGCRAAAYAATGSMNKTDPQCDAYRLFFEAFLWSWDDYRSLKNNLEQVRKMLH